jgi:hypothetical protein
MRIMSNNNTSARAVGVPVSGTEIMLQRWLSIIGPSALYNGTGTPSPVVTQPSEGWVDLTQYSFDSLNIGIHISLVNNALDLVAAGPHEGFLEVLSGYCLGEPSAGSVVLATLRFRLTSEAVSANNTSTVFNLQHGQPISKSNPNLGRFLFWRLSNIPTQKRGMTTTEVGNETLVCFEIKLQLSGGGR